MATIRRGVELATFSSRPACFPKFQSLCRARQQISVLKAFRPTRVKQGRLAPFMRKRSGEYEIFETAAHNHRARVSAFEFEQLRVALDLRVPILFITAYKRRTV